MCSSLRATPKRRPRQARPRAGRATRRDKVAPARAPALGSRGNDMIDEPIFAIAQQTSLGPHVVEKDYVLGWMGSRESYGHRGSSRGSVQKASLAARLPPETRNDRGLGRPSARPLCQARSIWLPRGAQGPVVPLTGPCRRHRRTELACSRYGGAQVLACYAFDALGGLYERVASHLPSWTASLPDAPLPGVSIIEGQGSAQKATEAERLVVATDRPGRFPLGH